MTPEQRERLNAAVHWHKYAKIEEVLRNIEQALHHRWGMGPTPADFPTMDLLYNELQAAGVLIDATPEEVQHVN